MIAADALDDSALTIQQAEEGAECFDGVCVGWWWVDVFAAACGQEDQC